MRHKLTALKVGLIAVLVLTAVTTSSASAANFTASSYPTTATGTSAWGNDTFITEGGTVECASHFQGTLTAASSTFTVTPKYTSCWAFGFLSATVTMNGCDYIFNNLAGSADSWTSKVDLNCSGLNYVVIQAPASGSVCTVTVRAQPGLSSISITNNTAAGDVSAKALVEGIVYSVTQDGFGCPFNGVGTKFGGKYVQHSAITLDSTNGATIDVG